MPFNLLKHAFTLLFIALSLCLSQPGSTATHEAAKHGEWWNLPYPEPFDATSLSRQQSTIRVSGNRLVDNKGETITLRGVNISDPDKLLKNGHWAKAHFAAVKNFGANVIRVPVHPIAWRSRGGEHYLALLDQAVHWANELDMYLIIDWHSIGNLHTGLFQHPMYDTNLQETRAFWRTIAARYKDVPTIAVYELFNEPTKMGGQLGELSWTTWKAINEDLIDIIFAHDPSAIPLVAGFNWAYDLRSARDNPIARKGIAYAAHPYPEKTRAPVAQKAADWEQTWGFIAKRAPLIATELGWMREGKPGAHVPVRDDGSYGPAIVKYLEKIGASWTVWCFDPDWPPQMIADWQYTPTEQGKFFRKEMLRLNK